MNSPKTPYTYDERNAIATVRRAMLRKPGIIEEIMKGSSREVAIRTLMQAKTELGQLLEVSRALVAAASTLAKKEEEHEPVDR